MKIRSLTWMLAVAPVFAQQGSVVRVEPGTIVQDIDVSKLKNDIKPDQVVATVNGKPVTAGQFNSLINGLQPTQKAAAQREPKRFLESWALFETILDYAAKNKLEEQSPYKERMAEFRRQMLVQTQIQAISEQIPVAAHDQKKYYDDHINSYKEAKGKMILVSFEDSPTPKPDPKAKKVLNQKQAEERAQSIVKRARAGEDFVKMVKEFSDDSGSVSRDGDIGLTIKQDTPNIPDPIKNTLLGMKTGEISNPILVEHGYYIFKADSVSVAPYDQVRDDIFKLLKDQGLKKWIDDQQKATQIKIENPLFFTPSQK